jgi:hypothetical protein
MISFRLISAFLIMSWSLLDDLRFTACFSPALPRQPTAPYAAPEATVTRGAMTTLASRVPDTRSAGSRGSLSD